VPHNGGTSFNVYETEYAGLARRTIAQWHVDEIETELEDLRVKGVEFQVFARGELAGGDRVPSRDGSGRLVHRQRRIRHVR